MENKLVDYQGCPIAHTLTENEIKAKALVIGRQLDRMAWYDMSAKQAESWCKDKAKELGAITSFDIDDIAYFAMVYVLQNNPR